MSEGYDSNNDSLSPSIIKKIKLIFKEHADCIRLVAVLTLFVIFIVVVFIRGGMT